MFSTHLLTDIYLTFNFFIQNCKVSLFKMRTREKNEIEMSIYKEWLIYKLNTRIIILSDSDIICRKTTLPVINIPW